MRRREIITLIVLVFSTIWDLSAQNTDTMYVVKKHIVRDTIYVRDTLRVQDTIIIADYIHSEEFKQLFYELNGADAQTPPDSLQKMWAQTVTFLENRVIHHEQQNISTMDSIKKYGLTGLLLLGLNSLAPAQTEAPQPAGSPHIKTESVLRDSPFNGFHFGYTAEAEIVHPLELIDVSTAKTFYTQPRLGGRIGLEFSYHFADYFGVSAALDLGINGLSIVGIRDYFGVSMPLKFEFHYPLSDKLWITANVGTQIRMPWRTFLYGYDGSRGSNESSDYLDDFQQIGYHNFAYNRNVFYADIMTDVGVYFQLPSQNYLRFLVGLDIATTDFARGYVSHYQYDGEQYMFQRNHYLYFQIAYLHGFSKQRAIQQAQPHWNTDKLLSRHEFRLGVSDHFGFLYRWMHQGSGTFINYGEDRVGFTSADYHFTPVISLDYHYRATKWFWLGLSTSYSFMKEKLYVGNVVSPDAFYWNCKEHHFLIMPSLRFSYLNRPHVTLYSGIAVGVLINRGNRYYGDLSKLSEFVPAAWGFVPAELPDHTSAGSAFQLTAFGVKAGGNHWFGSLELGAGIKGFVNLGVGYEF